MPISWDDAKRGSNIGKYGYDLAMLEDVFDGRFALTRIDGRRDYGELHYNMLAEYKGQVVNVTFTPRERRYHLISARPASRVKRKVFHARQGR
jgi:uncharacterized DUF497 family protein